MKQMKIPAFHNGPLIRMIQQASNPYHALHVARAYDLKSPKLKGLTPQAAQMIGNPWTMLVKK